MRIAFAGTPAFAATALAALLEAGHEVALVLSQPDRPAGRGQRLQASPVRQLALEHAIAVHTPRSLRPERGGAEAEAALAALRACAPEVLVVAAYGLLLPPALLQLPAGLALEGGGRAGALNIHASLLPRWRGAAPIVRAIEAGDTQTGVDIMQMEEGLDTGPILLEAVLPIGPQTTAGELTQALAQLGGRLIVQALALAARAPLPVRPQAREGIVYAHKVDKREAWIDWTAPAERIAARVRAFDPFPGACTALDGTVLKVWRAQPLAAAAGAPAAAPGTVLAADARGIVVACGAGAQAGPGWLRIEQLQRPGGRRVSAREFLAACVLAPGARLSGAALESGDGG